MDKLATPKWLEDERGARQIAVPDGVERGFGPETPKVLGTELRAA